MTHFTIKTHKPGTDYRLPHFFILNKGLNCGKPLKKPCPNCFVVQFYKEADVDSYYWLAYSLWQAKYWHQFLIGSVIPFFRIDEFTKEFTQRCERILFDFRRHQNQMRALRLLEEHETYHNENVKLIKHMRTVVLSWYLK